MSLIKIKCSSQVSNYIVFPICITQWTCDNYSPANPYFLHNLAPMCTSAIWKERLQNHNYLDSQMSEQSHTCQNHLQYHKDIEEVINLPIKQIIPIFLIF